MSPAGHLVELNARMRWLSLSENDEIPVFFYPLEVQTARASDESPPQTREQDTVLKSNKGFDLSYHAI